MPAATLFSMISIAGLHLYTYVHIYYICISVYGAEGGGRAIEIMLKHATVSSPIPSQKQKKLNQNFL